MLAFRRRAVPVLMTLVLAVAACGDDGGGSGGGGGGGGAAGEGDGLPATVRLGAITSITGPGAFCGENERDGMNLAVKQVNEEGLLGDSELELTIEDDATTPEGGLAAFQRLASSDVSAIVGPCVTTVAQGIAPLVDREEVPLNITTAAATDIVAPEFAYRTGGPQQTYAAQTADLLAERGVESIAIVYTNDNESISDLLDVVKPRLEELGIEITVEEGVASSATDFSAQIAQVRDSDPDAVAAFVFGAGNVTFVTQLREAGFDGPLYGHNGMAPPFFVENAGAAADGVVMTLSYHSSFEFPSSVAFTEAFEEEYGRSADLTAANGYDAVMRVVLAIEAAGSTDRQAVKEALDGLTEMDGAQGPIIFGDDGDATVEGGVVEIVNGEIVGAS